MIPRPLACAAVAVACWFFAGGTAWAVTGSLQPLEHLVYSFERNVSQTNSAMNQTPDIRTNKPLAAPGDQVPGSTGNIVNDATNNTGSRQPGGTAQAAASTASTAGTIGIDVLRRQSDGGLVVSVAERADGQTTTPATCVVYGNTSVVCDPNRKLNPEEYTLLRFLGPQFVDPTRMDAKQRWTIAQNNPGLNTVAHYAIVKNDDGQLSIDERLTIAPALGNGGTIVTSTIGYDFARSLPTSIDEHVSQNQDAGLGGTAATTVHTVLQLENGEKS